MGRRPPSSPPASPLPRRAGFCNTLGKLPGPGEGRLHPWAKVTALRRMGSVSAQPPPTPGWLRLPGTPDPPGTVHQPPLQTAAAPIGSKMPTCRRPTRVCEMPTALPASFLGALVWNCRPRGRLPSSHPAPTTLSFPQARTQVPLQCGPSSGALSGGQSHSVCVPHSVWKMETVRQAPQRADRRECGHTPHGGSAQFWYI